MLIVIINNKNIGRMKSILKMHYLLRVKKKKSNLTFYAQSRKKRTVVKGNVRRKAKRDDFAVYLLHAQRLPALQKIVSSWSW